MEAGLSRALYFDLTKKTWTSQAFGYFILDPRPLAHHYHYYCFIVGLKSDDCLQVCLVKPFEYFLFFFISWCSEAGARRLRSPGQRVGGRGPSPRPGEDMGGSLAPADTHKFLRITIYYFPTICVYFDSNMASVYLYLLELLVCLFVCHWEEGGPPPLHRQELADRTISLRLYTLVPY